MRTKLLSIILTVTMLLTLTAPAFATALPLEDVISVSLSTEEHSLDVDTNSAAKNVFTSLTSAQQKEFLIQIEALAYQGDTRLVEYHRMYVDPSYEFEIDESFPQMIAVAATDIARQLQALNLPNEVYYGLLALATALGVPVGNVVDLVISLGLTAIVVANWDAIKDVWSDIVNIFTNAFGSFVLDAFYYIQGLVGVYTVSVSGSTITINGKDYECEEEAEYVVASMKKNNHTYYPAYRDSIHNTVLVAPIDIPRKAALEIMRLNSSYAGVFTIADNYALSLCKTLGDPRGPEGESKSGYWMHYHSRNYPSAHCWFIS